MNERRLDAFGRWSAEGHAFEGARWSQIWQAHHPEGVEQAQQRGQERDQQSYLKGPVSRVGVDPEDLFLRRRALLTRGPGGPAVAGHQVLEALALGCLYTNRPGEAMACLDRWLAYSPGDSQALYLRGLARQGRRPNPFRVVRAATRRS